MKRTSNTILVSDLRTNGQSISRWPDKKITAIHTKHMFQWIQIPRSRPVHVDTELYMYLITGDVRYFRSDARFWYSRWHVSKSYHTKHCQGPCVRVKSTAVLDPCELCCTKYRTDINGLKAKSKGYGAKKIQIRLLYDTSVDSLYCTVVNTLRITPISRVWFFCPLFLKRPS